MEMDIATVEKGNKLEPIIEDFGEGYMAFCGACRMFLGWECDISNGSECPYCGEKIGGDANPRLKIGRMSNDPMD